MGDFGIPSGLDRTSMSDGEIYFPASGGDVLPGGTVSSKDEVMNDYYDAAFGGNYSANDYQDLNVDVSAEKQLIDDILSGTGADVSLSSYFNSHPGASMDDAFQFMASQSDEWAEKYLDYKLEKQSLEEQNAYSAKREDTAYQRLVTDLRAAGLNPALMYGSSASPSASNSLGYLRQSEGANSRTVGNFSKLKNLLLGLLSYELYRKLDTVDQVTGSFKDVTGGLKDLFQAFGSFFS